MITAELETAILQIVRGESSDPFRVLGPHLDETGARLGLSIRTFLPDAVNASVILPDASAPMIRIHAAGFFEAILPDVSKAPPYRLQWSDARGKTHETADPYSFGPILSDLDVYLLGEGTHLQAYEKLGAHVHTSGATAGVLFAVWAPNASRVSVVGDFNSWHGARHPMRSRLSGIWELFIPGLGEGERYKFEVRSQSGHCLEQKADPYAFYAELRPRTASIVYDIDGYAWGDEQWISERRRHNGLDAPLAMYEVHLGSWRRHADGSWLSYRELAHQLVAYVKDMGFTHIELLPVSEHPLDSSWGYQTTGYFAATSRYGAPEDFQYFVDHCHKNGIGVILDWVPAHFPMDGHGLRYFDGTHLYEHEDPRLGEHQDWGTAVFNYGRTEVRNFLIANALFWFDKYHIDGLRVDAVASMLYLDYSRRPGEWIPNRYGGNENLEAISLIKDLNIIVHGQHPDVLTIAEESTAFTGVSRPVYIGGLGFSLKWNMGWMHDTLVYFSKEPIHRKYHQNDLTFSMMYAHTENFVLVLSHDEVVHGKGAMLAKMPGDLWQKFANLRALYGLMYAFPGKKLLFMGGEIGQWSEWDHDCSLDWRLLEYESHSKLQLYLRDLNRLYRSLPQLHALDFHYSGFEWIDFADADSSVISFLRKADQETEDPILVVGNFTPVCRRRYKVGAPRAGAYRVIMNSDSSYYGGSNAGEQRVVAEQGECQGRPYALELTLPPLAVLYLRREG